ncbi:hypothetical protein [Amycolatopsis sp. GM8]|uniref:hypothetical protein n=1 Tax=Amycolatopsis sp. GM8 TaxID=2896530 RepID=UPI001F347407|nr:hypothetical protein [Amycolatopsis sp. GM8]
MAVIIPSPKNYCPDLPESPQLSYSEWLQKQDQQREERTLIGLEAFRRYSDRGHN